MTLKRISIILLVAAALFLIGVGVLVYGNRTDKKAGGSAAGDVPPLVSDSAAETTVPVSASSAAPAGAGDTAASGSVPAVEDQSSAPDVLPPPSATPDTAKNGDSKLIVIDAGHQSAGNSGLEPIGPGSSEMKAKVSSGTTGAYTGIPEYKLNLEVALLLQTELTNRGYTVIMVRTTHDVDISNSARAALANEAGADAFIRIHANGSEDPEENGVLTICQTKNNTYNGSIYAQCLSLSQALLDGIVNTTGANSRGVWQTDTMSGINWSKVPVTIVEMGYMTNEEEDRLMATEDYRMLIVRGIADGLDLYFEELQ